MTQDEIIEMARRCGFSVAWPDVEKNFVAFAKLVAERELEACWNIVFDYAARDNLTQADESLLKHIADLIKERYKHEKKVPAQNLVNHN